MNELAGVCFEGTLSLTPKSSFWTEKSDNIMIKKAFLTAGAVCLLSTLTVGVPLWSYARCGIDWVKTSATDAMPLEWEINRARQMIGDLTPEIEAVSLSLAREKVEVSKLEQEYDDAKIVLSKSRDQVKRLTDDLKRGSQQYTYAGKTYTSLQVKSDLEGRFKRLKTRTATANKLEQILLARQASLHSTQDRMSTMIEAKRQLEVEVENLEARLGALRVAETSSGLHIDDTQLAKTRDLIDDIAIRINVHEESMSIDTEYFDEIDLESTSEGDLLDEVATFLDESPDEMSSESFVAIQFD